jgi:peptidoglycan hydrolase-like protein with peptidoglycan-binding domain
VRWVQGVLVAAGATIEADGFFGHATDPAVRQFQAANGLDPDGVVGRQTWRALRRRSSATIV